MSSWKRWTEIACVGIGVWNGLNVMAADPVVSNVRATQRTGTRLFDITYDLADSDTTNLSVTVNISTNNGAAWFTPASSNLTGAVGAFSITPDQGKTIVWQGGRELPARLFPVVKAKVMVNDTRAVPAGMVDIPLGTNSGTDPDFGAYSLTNAEAFYMDATEVTKAKWDEVYSWAVTNGYSFDHAGLGKTSTHPVHSLNWYDCAKWCNARSQKEGRTPCYTVNGSVYKTGQSEPVCNLSANGYRLPTITEWAYAARGGLSGKRFPWGDTIQHTLANYCSSQADAYDTSPTRGDHPTYDYGGYPYTSPAGAFAANGYGLYDMAGNVSEWCNDTSGSGRYYSGGSWHDYALRARCGYSYWNYPDYVYYSNGFRSVCR